MSTLVGFVGWRGMVGSVLMDRMRQEKDFDLIEPVFFSTSNAGGKAPAVAKNETTLRDAHDIEPRGRCSGRHRARARRHLPDRRRLALEDRRDQRSLAA